MTASCAAQEKHILSRAVIRDASFFEMVNQKKQLREDDNELQILKRKLVRLDDTGK